MPRMRHAVRGGGPFKKNERGRVLAQLKRFFINAILFPERKRIFFELRKLDIRFDSLEHDLFRR